MSFNLFDVDANTPANSGADREEVLKITGTDILSNSITPTLTNSSANVITSDSAIGTSDALPTSTTGNVNVSFTSAVKSVDIKFSIQNIVGIPSGNAEPGYGLHDLSFCTPSIPLPIIVSEFTGHANPTNNTLFWKTMSEKNNSHFELYHGQNIEKLSKLTTVYSKAINGISQSDLSYSYNHNSPFKGVNYYQLHSISLDDERSICSTIRLINHQENDITIAPNPADQYLNIDVPFEETTFVNIRVMDLSGKLVYNSQQ